MKLTPIDTGAEIISFAEEKARRGHRWKNKFAEELYSVVVDIRNGTFDPDALFIAFRAEHPEDDTLVQYPISSIDMDYKMILAMTKYLMKQLKPPGKR